MELQTDFSRYTISELSLLELNKDNKYNYSTPGELNNRVKRFKQRILDNDGYVAQMRGYNVDNYLIGKNPTVQQLFEIYFSLVADSYPHKDIYSGLLFSETHLCNQMFFENEFFYKIYNSEINNLEKRIKSLNSNDEKKVLLSSYRSSLINNKQVVLGKIGKDYMGHGKYKFNEAFKILEDEELAQIYLKYGFGDASLYGNPGFNFFDYIHDLSLRRIVHNDKAKLYNQRSILLEQSKKGFEVDYSTISFQKKLK